MRCSYCYAGAKFVRTMPVATGCRAIERALASLEPGGTLELGFFGGEPLLEAQLVGRLADFARRRSDAVDARCTFTLTTNGTVVDADAWAVMTRPDMDLAVSFDGLPEVHDRCRRFADGRHSSARVLETMNRLLAEGKDFRVIMVVGPGQAARLADGIAFLRDMGVRHVEPTLDLWAHWLPLDAWELERGIAHAAQVWLDGLPDLSVGWFDEKAARLCGFKLNETARCLFGDGEVAVAPSGNLYPCERLIGEDLGSNAMRLPGHALDGDDFLHVHRAPPRQAEACSVCTASSFCNTTCRCSNYVRTGNVATPDRLLCRWNQACLRETARVLDGLRMCPVSAGG